MLTRIEKRIITLSRRYIKSQDRIKKEDLFYEIADLSSDVLLAGDNIDKLLKLGVPREIIKEAQVIQTTAVRFLAELN